MSSPRMMMAKVAATSLLSFLAAATAAVSAAEAAEPRPLSWRAARGMGEGMVKFMMVSLSSRLVRDRAPWASNATKVEGIKYHYPVAGQANRSQDTPEINCIEQNVN